MALAKAPVSLAAVRAARKPDRRTAQEDARLEVIALCDEVILAMHRVHDAELARDVPSAFVLNEAGRIAVKAVKARAEYLRLIGPDAAA